MPNTEIVMSMKNQEDLNRTYKFKPREKQSSTTTVNIISSVANDSYVFICYSLALIQFISIFLIAFFFFFKEKCIAG